MKALKKIITDPAFYTLVLLNIFFIYEYKDDPKKYNSIVWMFWCQSVLIGIFNFLDLLTTKSVDAKGFTMNDQPVDPQKSRGCYSFFFLFHYEFFHFVYFIFLIVQLGAASIDVSFLKFALAALTVNLVIDFIRHKQEYKNHQPRLSTMFFLPYLRIIPMHLMILVPSFLNIKPSLVFLVLKALFDVVGYVVTTQWYWEAKQQKP
jgi:hypothetical protein